MFCLVVFPILKFFLRFKVIGQENCKNFSGPMIIVANHKDYIDGVLLTVSIPWKSNLFPIRFMIWDKAYYCRWLHFLIKSVGGFPVNRENKSNMSARTSLRILEENGVVGIFPEGRMIKDEKLGKARPGIAFLSLKANAPILPVAIKGMLGASFKNFLLRRRRATVVIGKPFYLPVGLSHRNKDDLIAGVEVVMGEIGKLYYNSKITK